jgi:hypothetical protein
MERAESPRLLLKLMVSCVVPDKAGTKGEEDLRKHFKEQGWELVTAKEVAKGVREIAAQGAYIDHPAIAMLRCLEAAEELKNPLVQVRV